MNYSSKMSKIKNMNNLEIKILNNRRNNNKISLKKIFFVKSNFSI